MDSTKWPSLLNPALPVKKVSGLAPLLNMKSVPKWVTDELNRRQRTSVDECDTSNVDISEGESSLASTHSEGSRKLPIANFIHFSPLLATHVCLSPEVKTNDPALEKVGPDVAKLIRKCIAPHSLYGKILRESGEESLVVRFLVPREALSLGLSTALMTNLLHSRSVPHVQCSSRLDLKDHSIAGSEKRNEIPGKDQMAVTSSDNGSLSSKGIWSGTSENTTSLISRVMQSSDCVGSESIDEGLATVCFTVPCRFCVPLIQRLLEKAKIMYQVRESLLSGTVPSAINLISKILEEYSVDESNTNKRTEASTIYSFRSHLHFQSGAFKHAVKDATKAIELDPQQVEGYAVAIKSYIALGYPELACSVAGDANNKVSFLTTRFIRGSLLCNIVSVFQNWRSGAADEKIRLEVLPLPAAVRFAACRYNKIHSQEDITINVSSEEERHAVLDSYLTHPLKHPNHPGLSVGNFADLEIAGRNGFPDSARATATWINCVYSSSLALLKSELLDFCTSPMFFTCRTNRVHATRAFTSKAQIFEEKVSILLPALGPTTRIRMNGSTVVQPGDGVVWCNYCGGIIQTEGMRALPSSIVVCSLGCGATYCSEICRDCAAAKYHWIECSQSILLNIGAYGTSNWTAASFAIRRAFLALDQFIAVLAPEIKLSKKMENEKFTEKPDPFCVIAISMRLYKQIVATLLSFVLSPLLGVHPMPPLMEEKVAGQTEKLHQLLQELETKKIRPGSVADKYNLLLGEKVLQSLDIPFVVDANYSAASTVAEELTLCPSSDLIPRISRRDLKFGSAEQEFNPLIPTDAKIVCAQKIWIFTQTIAGSIREFLSEEPLPLNFECSEAYPCCSVESWSCATLLSFLGTSRFIPQLWDFCCSAYCIAEAPIASSNMDPKWREHVSQDILAPVIVISPHLSIITDLADFTGSYAHSRYCFEHEIQSRTVQPSADESLMSVRSLNESQLSISSQPQPVADAYDPSPWTQWCTSIATGCTNIDTPVVSVDGQHERVVTVTCSGSVQLDYMIRLKSAWRCV